MEPKTKRGGIQAPPDAGPQLDSRAAARYGVVGGLLAGGVFALFEMIVAAAMGMPVSTPWKMFASVLLGSGAMEGSLTFAVFAFGFIIHFALSAGYGAIWGVISRQVSPDLRNSFGAHSAVAATYGLAIWLVNFQIIARVLYPWFLGANAFAQILLHMLAFGLPLGLYMVTRFRPLGRVYARRTHP